MLSTKVFADELITDQGHEVGVAHRAILGLRDENVRQIILVFDGITVFL